MLKRIVMLVSGLSMARSIQALVLPVALLWNRVNSLLVNCIRAFLNVGNQLCLYVKMLLSTKVFPANPTIVEPLTKVEHSIVKPKHTELGKQQQTTVHPTHRRAKRQSKRGK